MGKINKILVANRSEIAIRIFRAANELGLKTVAVYALEDRLALHRFKADESYHIGDGLGPVEAYLNINEYIRIAKQCGADAIHPGYGLLSESPEFADACHEAGIIFVGPRSETMRSLGNKVAARHMAQACDVPVVPATPPLPDDLDACAKLALDVGYPLMLKASWGGGGRGMRVIRDEAAMRQELLEAKREAKAAFGKDEMYFEKLIERARHVEVQLIGDDHGHLVHLFERDCSIQRRNQKVVERAPAPYLSDTAREGLADAAKRLGHHANYRGAGTVEFLMDADTEAFYFIEVNPRVQVEHTVTEEVTGIDIVKAQIRIADGGRIGDASSGVPEQEDIQLHGHALQCRITTEDPDENFIPDYGRITAYRGATGFGVRLDGGTAYAGAVITRYYDPLLEKVTCWAPTPQEALDRMDRALREFRIRGVTTNLAFLENIITHPKFRQNDYTTKFIDNTPELFRATKKRDRATKLLSYIADVTVNGHPDVRDRQMPPAHARQPFVSYKDAPIQDGARQILDNHGPEALRDWIKSRKELLLTDTSMRDGHQSLLATRIRTHDIVKISRTYAQKLPQLFSLECWGGATFDVAMRFLTEDPWNRLAQIREAAPNMLTQMLLRGSNAVGYTNYPDNAVKFFVEQAAKGGVDIFRTFDCLNWVDNMRVAMDAVLESGKVLEATLCYTGDVEDERRDTYTLKYYVDLAKQLEAAGAHILNIKDMAGLLKPSAAGKLIKALKDATSLPIHLHTHDTSGISAATLLVASEAGVDIVDAAMDALSGTTSQPCLGSIVAALKGQERDTGLDAASIREISSYWETVRTQYRAFETDLRSGASEVYLHEMPGGQFTNLKEQARSLGLESQWHEVAQAYADVNQMFGDIVKVTPSSKVVGDMALAMVSAGLTKQHVQDPDIEVSFPDSVVSFFKGDIGQPPRGFPEKLQKKVLKGAKPLTKRPGADLPDLDLEAVRKQAQEETNGPIDDLRLASYIMYPKVFTEFKRAESKFGPTEILPTSVYFYGLKPREEILVDMEPGKTLVVQYLGQSETNEQGRVRAFFELNGQPRSVSVPDRKATSSLTVRPKADEKNRLHMGAPMPGVVSTLAVKAGDTVAAGDVLLSIEAMKMETAIHADRDGVVANVHVKAGEQIDAKDLLVEFEGS